jgi:lysophospholipase L1-like esterase
VRGSNAYPLQMQNSALMPGPVAGQKPLFTMKSCTGDVTETLMDVQNSNYQLAAVRSLTSFVTLSIGGNDVEFANILKSCVYGLGGNCDDRVNGARSILYGQDFYNSYMKLMKQILQIMGWQNRQGQPSTAIYQTGYSQFFNAYTDQCDHTSFMPYDPINVAPLITKDLRITLNRLTHEVNYMLAYWIDILNFQNSKPPTPFHQLTSAINFVNADMIYTGHRFCRDGVTEPDRNNADTWFFHLLGSQGETGLNNPNNLSPSDINSQMDQYYNATGQDLKNAPLWITKTFHPTSEGMQETAGFLISPKLRYYQAVQAMIGITFDIMVLGDIVPYASQDPNSPIFQGFIPHLKALFRDHRFMRTPLGNPAISPRLNFIGSQHSPNLGGEFHECYQDVTINDLLLRFQESLDSHSQNKFVILQAGTKDLLYGEEDQAPNRLAQLVYLIYERDPNAVILLGQIPMVGLNHDGSTWPDLLRRVVAFNARVAALADQVSAQGHRIFMIHTSATTYDHRDGDFVLPSPEGYLRMAFDYAEGMVWAALTGWVHNSNSSDVPVTQPISDISKSMGPTMVVRQDQKNDDIGRNMAPSTGDIQTDTIVCTQQRDDTQAQGSPNADDLVKSYLRDSKDEDDFINNVACKFSTICGLSLDGLVCILATSLFAYIDANALL